jgi:PAS domain S-box-containing protein
LKSLRVKLAVALTLALAALILAGALMTLHFLRQELRQAAADQLLSLAGQTAAQMDGDLADAASFVRAVAETIPADAVTNRQAIARHMEFLPVPAGSIDRCVAIDASGQALAQKPTVPPLGERNFSERDYFRDAIRVRKTVFSQPRIGAISGRPVVVIAAPRLGPAGEVALVMACSIGLLDLGAFSHARTQRIGETGHVVVITPERQFVVHPDAQRLTGEPQPQGHPVVDLAASGHEGLAETRNFQGRPVLVGVRKLGQTGWSVVALSFVEEAYRPLREARDRVIPVSLALLAGGAILAWLLAGLMVAPLRRLAHHVTRLRNNSGERMPPLPVRNDEVGELAQAFNALLAELREREAGIKFSEEKFYKAFHSNPDFTMISRLRDGRIVEVNEGFEQLLGISAAEAVGKMSVADLHMWGDARERELFVQRLSAEGTVRDFPTTFIARGDEVRMVEITATTIELAGEPHIIGTARDVTELKRSQEALRLSEERFAKAFQANPNYASVSRLEDGKFVAVNAGFERLTGWKAEEVLGRTALEIGLWAEPAERDELVRHLKAEGEWHGFHSHFRTKAGNIRLVEGSCVLVEIAGEQQIVGVARDITEVARAEQALRQSEEKFSKIFHASPDWIIVVRLEDGLILDANEGFERLSGYAREEAVGRTTTELGLWAFPENRKRFVQDLRASGSLSDYEFEVRTRAGELRDMRTSSVAIEIGNVPCMISIVRDVTDQRRTEEEIRNLNVALEHRVKERTAELEEANRELESFSYSVSHDLRSPLRAIAGYAKVIEEDYAAQIGEEGRAQLDRIIFNAIRMGELIDDMLDFSRIGRAEMKRAPIDMVNLARDVLAELPEAVAGGRVEVRIKDMPDAHADRSLVRQVWSNLIGNALKFTRHREKADIEVGGMLEAGEAHYYVRDNGAGFDMAYSNKLFHVFQRLHRDTAFEGTGVGLAIVARIVQRHGGRVWAEGVVDEGATFHFTLPAASG